MNIDASETRAKKSFWRYAIVPILGFIALATWGLSSPVGSSPDDNFHLVSIWCGQGERAGYCEKIPHEPELRAVPMWVSGAACYAYNPEASSECQTEHYGEPTQLVNVDYGNFNNIYPPVFYWVMSLFVGSNTIVSVLAMRLLNTLLFVGMVTVTYFLIPQRYKKPMLWGALLASVPLGLFVIPSTNPSSWAITSATTLWALLIGFVETNRSVKKYILGGLSLAATVIGAGARADSAIFSAIAVCVVIIISRKKVMNDRWLSVFIFATILFICAAFYLNAGQTEAAASGLGEGNSGNISQKIYLTIVNLLQVPMIWTGILGSWGLGWLDTTLPHIVEVSSFVIFAGMAFWGLGLPQRNKKDLLYKLISVTLLFSALWFYPTAVLVQTGAMAGGYFQPRYILPLAIMFLGILLIGENAETADRITRPQKLLIILSLGVANAVSLHSNMRRYITGTDLQGWNLNSHIEWWWNLPFSPMTIWIVGSIAFFAVLYCTFPIFSTRRSSTLGK